MYYFAYGANMLRETIEKRVMNVNKKVIKKGTAILDKFEIVFNKPSSRGKFVFSNIRENQNKFVYGVVYELTEDQLKELDKREKGYIREKKKVKLTNGDEVEAYVYIAKETKEGLKPLEIYVKDLIKGAKENNLPENYIKEIISKAGIDVRNNSL